jgi:hypothetical protein
MLCENILKMTLSSFPPINLSKMPFLLMIKCFPKNVSTPEKEKLLLEFIFLPFFQTIAYSLVVINIYYDIY